MKPDHSNICKITLHKFDLRKWSKIIAFCLRKSREILSSADFRKKLLKIVLRVKWLQMKPHIWRKEKRIPDSALKKKKITYVAIDLPCVSDLPVYVSTQLSSYHFCVSVSLFLSLSIQSPSIHLPPNYLSFFFFLSIHHILFHPRGTSGFVYL